MVREVSQAPNPAWLDPILKYPSRYGSICGLFDTLLEDLERGIMPSKEMTAYYRARFNLINSDKKVAPST